MKVLIKSLRNLDTYYVHAYETWKKALAKVADVSMYGEGYPGFKGWEVDDAEIYDALGRPDIEIWAGGPGIGKPPYNSDEFILKNPEVCVPKLILFIDYWEVVRNLTPEKWRLREEQLKKKGVVGYMSFYSQFPEWMKRVAQTTMEKFVIFPYIYDDSFAELSHLEKKWDVNAQLCLSKSYPFRNKVFSAIKSNRSLSVFNIDKMHQYKDLRGSADPLQSFFGAGTPSKNYASLVNSCKITIACGYTKHAPQGPRWGFNGEDLFLARYPQTLASSGVLFCPKITSTHIEDIIDGEHYVSIDAKNASGKIASLLANDDERNRIAKNATEWARRNCSSDKVANMILENLRSII